MTSRKALAGWSAAAMLSVACMSPWVAPVDPPAAVAVGSTQRSPHWDAVRDAHIAKHPACEACGSPDDLAVHHVKPFHLYPQLELDPNNLISLCSSDRTPDNGIKSLNCHLHIGHRCADGRGRWTCENPNVRKDAAAMRRKTYREQGAK